MGTHPSMVSTAGKEYYRDAKRTIIKDLTVSPEMCSSADNAIERFVQRNHRVYIQMAAANPVTLVQAMADQHERLNNVEVCHMHLEGKVPYLDDHCRHAFRMNSFFLSAATRQFANNGQGDFTPCFFSEVPKLFRKRILPIDVALIQVSPPDVHGWCSMGVSVDCSLAAMESARFVIAQINPNMPRTHGDGLIHVNHMDAMVEVDDDLPSPHGKPLTPEEVAIGRHVASLIPDKACLQMGIGAIPDAVLAQLGNHKDLGIHTEMMADGAIPLVQRGVITNNYKAVVPGKIVTTFLVGSKNLYDFVDDNPQIVVLDVGFVNDPAIIAKNPRVHAINSAIEVDLTGQVSADSIGTKLFSGVGGQMDFMRAAAISEGGKPIIALPSTTTKGESRIVPFLKPGAGVVTTRAHLHYVVTEYGIAEIRGKSLRERAKLLIGIAHPSHRDALTSEAVKRFGPL